MPLNLLRVKVQVEHMAYLAQHRRRAFRLVKPQRHGKGRLLRGVIDRKIAMRAVKGEGATHGILV